MNNFCTNITFTIEEEEGNNKINFLDIPVSEHVNSIQIGIYRKRKLMYNTK
jgi:hypothetical protein